MANPQDRSTQNSPRPGARAPATDEQKRKQRDASHEAVENEQDETDIERVEIGDPVPEGDRRIKASRTSPGETGEDEDLPDDEGGVEGRVGPH